eukprot:comp19253_c0_seq1/m.22041 comp19253_c0_seq1/g.22041  ORF comp19253_c0_seq1/g.22041 comp19253_c0_seq1/m.22041 type:complete len:149 (-) comp19253_c0_seq1:540-986(-)
MPAPKEFEAAASFICQLVGHKNTLTPAQLQQYERALLHVMEQNYMKSWYPDQPLRGSGNRCIRVHLNKIDPVLLQAAQLSNLENVVTKLFPAELVLWVDPRSVCYKPSEFSPIVTIYDGETRTQHKQTGGQQTPQRGGSDPFMVSVSA